MSWPTWELKAFVAIFFPEDFQLSIGYISVPSGAPLAEAGVSTSEPLHLR